MTPDQRKAPKGLPYSCVSNGGQQQPIGRALQVGISTLAVLFTTFGAHAQSSSSVNLCADLGIQLPGLTATTAARASVGLPLVDTALRGVTSDIDQNIVTPLSNAGLRLGRIDASNNVTPLNRQNCNVQASSVELNNNKGISLGGGRMDGLGSGQPAAAGDTSAIAIGNGSQATGTAALGLGTASRATGIASIALGLRGGASADGAVAVGQDATAAANGSVALGRGSIASETNTVSVGSAGSERRIVNVAAGRLSEASTDVVNGSQLHATNLRVSRNTIDIDNLTQGRTGVFRADNTGGAAAPEVGGANAVAGGYGAVASGQSSTAIGTNAQATQADAMAVGAGAHANHANSIAIGTGAATTRTNQVMIGRSNQTYTLAGIASAQSRAAQSGPTRYLTTDGAGNLATASYGPSDVGALTGRVSSLEDGLNGLGRYAVESRREARQGIAASMAMTSASMPSLPGKTTWALNTATFRGEWAGGAALAHRLDMAVPIAVTAGFSYSDTTKQGARVGLAGEF